MATAPVKEDIVAHNAPETVAEPTTEQIIIDAANRYGLSPQYMLNLAHCESTTNPKAVNKAYYENGNPSGLYQHISGYFPARALKYGYSTDVFDAYSNAGVTAAMIKDGLSYLWECRV